MADAPFDGNNVSERQLKWGMWFIANRPLLRRIGYGILIAVAAISWGYTLWGLIDYFFVRGLDLDRAIARDTAVAKNPRAAILQRQAARPVQIAEVHLLTTAPATYDAVARVVNPNPGWIAAVEYALEVPGSPTAVERAVLLPGRERWLMRLNAESKANPSGATLVVRKVDWARPSRVEAADPQRFMGERLNVEVRQPVFIPSRELALGGGTSLSASVPATGGSASGGNVSRAAFTIVNQSAYGLRDLELAVLLRRGQAIVGVNRITLADVRAGEERAAAATWFHPLGLVQSVEVFPYVNVFDPRNFIAL